MPEIYSFTSVRNFRDFGGYKAQGASKLATGKLFRSADFAETNTDDKNRISALNLDLVVDLRHQPERVRQPSFYPSASDVTTFTLIEKQAEPGLAPHEMFMKEHLNTADDSRNYMLKSYTARPNAPQFIDIFSRTLAFMAEEGGPLVICAAGKDRTGTLAAIIQKILGMDDEEILEDYMLTMKAVDIDSFLEPAAAFMSKRFERQINADALGPMFGVEPGYLGAALQAMGAFENYVGETLNISPQQCSAIRENYLD